MPHRLQAMKAAAGAVLLFSVVAVTLTHAPWAANSADQGSRLRYNHQTRQQTLKDRHLVPVADGAGEATRIRSSSRSPSVFREVHRPPVGLAVRAANSPGIQICSGTSYNYQHNDDGQKQIATLGSGSLVHFAWTYWDVAPGSLDAIDRFVNYNAYSTATGLKLGDCGGIISGAGANAQRAFGGYPTIDVGSDDNAHPAFHQRDSASQTSSPGPYSSWVLDQGIPGFDLFAGNLLPGALPAAVIWPHIAIDRGSGLGAPGNDVFHVCSHITDCPFGPCDMVFYWRRIGNGSWEGPVVLDNVRGLSYHIATDPTGPDVAVVYERDQDNAFGLADVCYLESPDNGANWIAQGVPIFPSPVAPVAGGRTYVTNYGDPNGPQATMCGLQRRLPHRCRRPIETDRLWFLRCAAAARPL